MNSHTIQRRRAIALLASTSIALTLCGAANAQTSRGGANAASTLGEIIVTARKRQESILNVPVIETALPQQRLERLQITQMNDLPSVVPGLNFSKNVLDVGTQVNIRGVGSSSSDPGIDPSVALTIDGLSMANGLAFESGMFDLAQIEVLKGPQSLFYGKGTPGGVISLRTADPTSAPEIIVRGAYGFESLTRRAELIVSGPVTDTLKLRVAGLYQASAGYFRNIAVPVLSTGALPPAHRRASHTRSYEVRGTALWNPTSQFDARLKLNYVHDYFEDLEATQLSSCPDGVAPTQGFAFIDPSENCKLDRYMRVVRLNPVNFPGISNNGVPFTKSNQKFGTLELNYHPTKDLTATSVTGYYLLRSTGMLNSTETQAAAAVLSAEHAFRRRDFTEELRLNSDFSGPVNFSLGAFYQDGSMINRIILRGNNAILQQPLLNAFNGDGVADVDIKTISAFGQARWAITPQIELAAGARWTDERRTDVVTNLRSFTTGIPTQTPLARPKLKANNVAPEVTITYKPAEYMTLFAAYKQGFKSGSFTVGAASTIAPGTDVSFNDEKAKGGEAGFKALLADRQVAVNVAGYYYKYRGLQVGAVQPAVNGIPVTRTVNAGGAKSYGVDFDFDYRPQTVEGLNIHGAVNWNHARYTDLKNIPCWGGQTIALGCNLVRNPNTGLFTAQDLSGTPMIRAPAWQGNIGFDYDVKLSERFRVTFSSNAAYSSKYVSGLAINRPNNDNYQPAFAKVDFGLTLRPDDDRWELALIGKNITDKITAPNCHPSNFQGSSLGGQITGGPAIAGGPSRGTAGLDESGCFVEPGREVWLRFTYTPLKGR